MFLQLETAGLQIDAALTPSIRFYWKLSSNKDFARAVILRMASTPTQVDYHASELQLFPRLDRVSSDGNAAGDSFGTMAYSGWFAYDSNMTRRIVLAGVGS